MIKLFFKRSITQVKKNVFEFLKSCFILKAGKICDSNNIFYRWYEVWLKLNINKN